MSRKNLLLFCSQAIDIQTAFKEHSTKKIIAPIVLYECSDDDEIKAIYGGSNRDWRQKVKWPTAQVIRRPDTF